MHDEISLWEDKNNIFRIKDTSTIAKGILTESKTQPAKGATQSAAEFYHRVNIEECLYTDNFEVTDACISCGHCEDICPAYAIKLNEDGIPTWVKHECFMCFGCMRLCPCQAIRYGGA